MDVTIYDHQTADSRTIVRVRTWDQARRIGASVPMLSVHVNHYAAAEHHQSCTVRLTPELEPFVLGAVEEEFWGGLLDKLHELDLSDDSRFALHAATHLYAVGV